MIETRRRAKQHNALWRPESRIYTVHKTEADFRMTRTYIRFVTMWSLIGRSNDVFVFEGLLL